MVEQLQKSYAGFLQDDWKLARNLTLNLGLRYEYTTPYYGARPNVNINFDFKTGQLVTAKNPADYLVNADHSNIGPRIGIAWQIKPQKIVMRGGYGIFYSGEDMSGSDINLPLNPPQLTPITLIRVGTGPAPLRLSDPIPSNIFDNYNTSIVSLRAREKDYHAAMIQQFNLALQFLLPLKSTFEVAYVGNRGHNLLAQYSLNQTAFGVDGSIAANRPYPQWSQINVGAQRAESWYNSLQVKWEKRLTRGWYELASYTFASALDEAGAWGAGSSPQYLDNFRADRGPQSQTARQRFTLSSIYELPVGRGRHFGAQWSRPVDAILGGWQLAGILGTRTGLPVTISLNGTSTDPVTKQSYRFFSRNGGGLRPNRIGTPNTDIDPKADRQHFLDPAAFAVQPVNTPGNSQRNVAMGPKAFNTSLSLVKQFRPTEKTHARSALRSLQRVQQGELRQPRCDLSEFGFRDDLQRRRPADYPDGNPLPVLVNVLVERNPVAGLHGKQVGCIKSGDHQRLRLNGGFVPLPVQPKAGPQPFARQSGTGGAPCPTAAGVRRIPLCDRLLNPPSVTGKFFIKPKRFHLVKARHGLHNMAPVPTIQLEAFCCSRLVVFGLRPVPRCILSVPLLAQARPACGFFFPSTPAFCKASSSISFSKCATQRASAACP